MNIQTAPIGGVLVLLGFFLLLRSTGLFEAIETEVLVAVGVMTVGAVLLMQRQK